jgi:hypothetical protein
VQRAREHHGTMTVRFNDSDFQRGLQVALASVRHHMADRADVLATALRVKDGDPGSWLDEWMATAGPAWAAARVAEHTAPPGAVLIHYRHAVVAEHAPLKPWREGVLDLALDGERLAEMWNQLRERQLDRGEADLECAVLLDGGVARGRPRAARRHRGRVLREDARVAPAEGASRTEALATSCPV